MITVYLAICMLSTPAHQCNKSTAVYWVEAQELQGDFVSCFIYGQLVAARRQLLDNSTYLKVFCRAPAGLPFG